MEEWASDCCDDEKCRVLPREVLLVCVREGWSNPLDFRARYSRVIAQLAGRPVDVHCFLTGKSRTRHRHKD